MQHNKLGIIFTSMMIATTAFANESSPQPNINNALDKSSPTSEQVLKTKVPFKSLCGQTLTVLPPDKLLISEFALKAAIQSFTYDYKERSAQFNELQKCYSASGWKGFMAAMNSSGNLTASEQEQLFVSAKTIGDTKILAQNTAAFAWKMLVPLEVRYENKTHYLTQSLKVKLVVTVEDKQLKVDQIIASPSDAPHPYEKQVDKEIFKGA